MKFALSLALTTLISGCSTYMNFNKLDSNAKLYVNTSKTHYYVERDLAQGEKDLVKIARHSKIEEAFAYYNNKYWVEIGEHEKEFEVVMIIGDLNSKYYHIHPSDNTDEKRNFMLDDLIESRDKLFDSIIQSNFLNENIELMRRYEIAIATIESGKTILVNAFPSHRDIYSLSRSINRQQRLDENVVSEFGIMQYELERPIWHTNKLEYEILLFETLYKHQEAGLNNEQAIKATVLEIEEFFESNLDLNFRYFD